MKKDPQKLNKNYLCPYCNNLHKEGEDCMTIQQKQNQELEVKRLKVTKKNDLF